MADHGGGGKQQGFAHEAKALRCVARLSVDCGCGSDPVIDFWTNAIFG